jgi:choline-sulfatase
MARGRKHPNILFVMFDQMAALSLPSYGHPVVKAPNIARLAKRGTMFENAYSTAPLCSPSRFGMLTGMRPSRFGAYDNAAELPAEIPTFLHHLRNAGYRTCLSGKMDFTGADQLHGYEERLTTDLSPSDFGWVPDWEHPDAVQPWFHTLQSVAEAGSCEYSLSLQYDEDACDRGVDWLQQVTGEKGDRPFMLTVSVMQPHDPYQGLRKFWDLYDPKEIDLPVEPKRKAGRRNQVEERMYRLYDRDEIPLSARQIRDARRAYYAMISYCDDLLGRLMRTLEIAGVADDTIIVVTSDHGDMLGERGLWYKMNFYDRAIRVPLIVAGPGIKRQRVKAPVSHLDLLPTFLDLVRNDAPRDLLDGASLWPSLTRGTAPKGELVGEYCGEGYDAPVVMIRRGCHKFLHSRHLQPELYDLETDAAELRNLAGEPSRRNLVEALTAEAEARWDLEGLRAQVIASQRRRRLVHQALVTGRVAAWDFAPRMDAAAAYYRNYDPDMPDPDRVLRRPSRVGGPVRERGGA